MKKLIIPLFLILMFLSLIPQAIAQEIEFSAYMNPSYFFVSPMYELTFAKGNHYVVIEILGANNAETRICGISATWYLYGTHDVHNVQWLDAGGSPVPSIVLTGGFESFGGETYWDFQNDITAMSWDGTLPDTVNHTAIGCLAPSSGWPADDPLKPRYQLHLVVPLGYGDTGSVCIDSVKIGGDDWLFDPLYTAIFDGPYCWEFADFVYMPPEITDCPISLTTNHTTPFDVTYNISSGTEYPPATGVGAVDEYDNPLGTATLVSGGTRINWVFDPPCEWVNDGLEHEVKLYAEDDINGAVFPNVLVCTIELIVTDGPSEIAGDCDASILAMVGESGEANFELTPVSGNPVDWSFTVDHNPYGLNQIYDGALTFIPTENDDGNDYTFTIHTVECTGEVDECSVKFYVRSSVLCGDSDYDGEINILDIVFLINSLYKGGPGPGPMECSDLNNDAAINILDIVYLINYIYKSGPAPDCPS